MYRPLSVFTIASILFIVAPGEASGGIIRKAGVKLAFTSAGQSYDLTYLPGNETDR